MLTKNQRNVRSLILRSADGYWNPERVMKKIKEEARELGDVVRQKPLSRRHVEKESGDLLFAIACLLNPLGISFDRAIERSIKKFSRRDRHLYHRKRV